MRFHVYNPRFQFAVTFLISVLLRWTLSSTLNGGNNTIFLYQDISQCKRYEFYNLDYFTCVACNVNDGNLQPTEDKFACKCAPNTVTLALYDNNRERPICASLKDTSTTNGCQSQSETTTAATSTEVVIKNNCELLGNSTTTVCDLKYVNRTMNELEKLSESTDANGGDIGQKQLTIRITRWNPYNTTDCYCDLKYNFRYQDYCIANELLKPYLHFNSFWQPTTGSGGGGGGGIGSVFLTHFSELKFVAFFCLRLHNTTACNHLANLCIISHYSLDKNSPCSAFLLSQASDVVIRYAASMDDRLQGLRPFLFFKKGKQTAELLMQPIADSRGYSLGAGSHTLRNQLEIFSMSYTLEGNLQRRGTFELNHANLCGAQAQHEILFARRSQRIECALTLERLIDLATLASKRSCVSLFLNFTNNKAPSKTYMHTIPILIDNLIPENQRNQPTEWLLVKRFQMITSQPRLLYGPHKPSYDDSYKLQLYRTLRYVKKFEFQYKIYAQNRIAVPLVRLYYRQIEIQANSTLNDKYDYQLLVTFEKVNEANSGRLRDILNEGVLPMLVLIAVFISILHAYNYRKRRRAAILTHTSTPSSRAAALSSQPVPMELCDFRAMLEFLLQLCSNVSLALFACFLLHVIYVATQFLTQRIVQLTLPLTKADNSSLEILIYAALLLKLIFCVFHLWRNSHFDLFFIDWERPKSYDNNHYNLKSNLETSSVCSSIRTFITENNVSAWRVFFIANEWIRMSVKRKSSTLVQTLGVLVVFKFFDIDDVTQGDLTLQLFFIILIHVIIYVIQQISRILFINRITRNPLKKFIDLCSWANISVFILLEPYSYGFYIHGRSPHGFADTDMSSMIMQLQRESQSMCGRRGLLNDSDQQSYIILPPTNLRTYFQRLLIPFQRSCSISQAHYQKETSSSAGMVDGNLERTFIAYSSVNRFFCAFIDHAIKDMDYIVKDKTVIEKIFDCEFENYLTENKGTFYIDTSNSFSQLFLYGNEFHIFFLEFLFILCLFMLTGNLLLALVLVCVFDVLVQWIFSSWMRRNVSTKTLIDKRFLI